MSGKRSIFEEVGGAAPRAPAPVPGGIERPGRGGRGALRVWLIVLFVMVAAMILVGGLTRLTDSGLSITEWKPVTGALPPMGAAAWDDAFAKYQEFPEYQMQNKGMALAEFKFLYWWEWGHRQLGRAIGLVWALGFVFFWATKRIPAGWVPRLLGVGALGGLQGAIGWWMVSSGLGAGMLDVASYRLATHLGLAFVILAVIGWFVLALGRADKDLMQARRSREARLYRLTGGLMLLGFLQIILGALVAGIDAGRGFTDWPLMAGSLLPPDMFSLTPGWRNFFEDDGLVQFSHRIVAYLLFIAGIALWRVSRNSGNVRTRRAFDAVAAMLALQVGLGIATVMNASPLPLAILHQLGAIVLWVLILRARFLSHYPIAQSIRGTT